MPFLVRIVDALKVLPDGAGDLGLTYDEVLEKWRPPLATTCFGSTGIQPTNFVRSHRRYTQNKVPDDEPGLWFRTILLI